MFGPAKAHPFHAQVVIALVAGYAIGGGMSSMWFAIYIAADNAIFGRPGPGWVALTAGLVPPTSPGLLGRKGRNLVFMPPIWCPRSP